MVFVFKLGAFGGHCNFYGAEFVGFCKLRSAFRDNVFFGGPVFVRYYDAGGLGLATYRDKFWGVSNVRVTVTDEADAGGFVGFVGRGGGVLALASFFR